MYVCVCNAVTESQVLRAVEEGVRNLRQSGLLKVKAGLMSLEEVEAVTNE